MNLVFLLLFNGVFYPAVNPEPILSKRSDLQSIIPNDKTLTNENENCGYLFHLLPDIDIWLDTERCEATEATEGEVARSVR